MDHNAKGSADALTALKEVHELLSAHPSFGVVPVRVPSALARRTSLLGLAIKSYRFLRFGAKFDCGLTLLSFKLRVETPRTVILDLQWHATRIDAGLSVFIHFVDAADEIRFQGDYPLEIESPDTLGFIYSRRRVEVPKETPAGMYRVRLGVWRPTENKHVRLDRFRGCQREPAGWCHDAVILSSIELGEPQGMTSDPLGPIRESRPNPQAPAGTDSQRSIDQAHHANHGDAKEATADALKPFLDWFAVHSVDLAERMTNTEFESALGALLILYKSRPDLQAALPEVSGQDFKRFIDWTSRVAREDVTDSSAETLKPFPTVLDGLTQDSGTQSAKAGIATPAESVCDAYHAWYYSHEIWKTTKFLDVLTYKSVTDLWNYQEILTELKPSLVLELGTYQGGSALYFAETLRLVSPHFRVLTVDIDHNVVAERVRRHDCIELLESDTTNPKVAARFKELRRAYPGKAFCIVDSDHNREHVIAELMLLREVTEPGDYVVVEDGNINGHPVLPDWGVGPYEALEEYLERYPDDYISDVVREKKFGFTFAPKGFLIRRDSHTEPPPGPTTIAWNNRLEAQGQQRSDTERVIEQATSQAAHYKNLLDEQQQQTKDARDQLAEALSQAAHYKNLLDDQRQLRADAENRLRDRRNSE
jgi:cephalosporin hydroxylase